LIAVLLLCALAAPLIASHRANSADSGDVTLQQETWLSLWEGDGTSDPSTEGWWVREFGSTTITPGVSDGATVAFRDDNDPGDGGWMQRFIDFEPPFKIATRARYDPTTTRSDDVGIPYVYTGTHSFAAIYYPTFIRIGGVPSFDIPTVRGEWHNITFEARAPLDVDVYVDGSFVRNMEMSPASDITFDQPDCKPAITALTTTIEGRSAAMVDYIRTTLPVIQEGPIKNCERIPPLVSVTLDDGVNLPANDLIVTKGATMVWLNATVDDTQTGNSKIWSANYTVGPANWPGTRMTAADGNLDSPMENVTSAIDTGALPLGDYTYCVYGRDYLGNWNQAGTCAVLHIVPELPSSQVDPIVPYWWNSPVNVTAASTDGSLPVNAVSLYYCHSANNVTWGAWTLQGLTGLRPWNWTFSFLEGEGYYAFYSIARDDLGNEEPPPIAPDALAAYDTTPPSTDIVIGDPKYLIGGSFVTSHTSLTFRATDGGVAPVGLKNISYRIDGVSWTNYSVPFNLGGEGEHVVEYGSADLLGNVEPTHTLLVIVDNTPPTTSLSTGDPSYVAAWTYVNSSTLITLHATDGGAVPVGPDLTILRIWDGAWSLWSTYQAPLRLQGPDGVRYIEFQSKDLLGNLEAVQSVTIVLDNTPPDASVQPDDPRVVNGTTFAITAGDGGGCGVAGISYSVDLQPWNTYSLPFNLSEGLHVIRYRTWDHLGNMAEKSHSVEVFSERPPSVETGSNYKPAVATVFAIVLAVVGLLSSRRRPWGGEAGGTAMVKAFTYTAVPFVAAEAVTGFLSLFIRELWIPPVFGLGTAVDVVILVAGLVILVYRSSRRPTGRPV
jgi:hypothetical protein